MSATIYSGLTRCWLVFNPAPARFSYNRNLFILLNFCNCRVVFKNRCLFKRASTEPAPGQPALYNQALSSAWRWWAPLETIHTYIFIVIRYPCWAINLWNKWELIGQATTHFLSSTKINYKDICSKNQVARSYDGPSIQSERVTHLMFRVYGLPRRKYQNFFYLWHFCLRRISSISITL